MSCCRVVARTATRNLEVLRDRLTDWTQFETSRAPTSRRSDAGKPEVETKPVETNWYTLKLRGPQPLAGAMLKSTRLGHHPRGDKL